MKREPSHLPQVLPPGMSAGQFEDTVKAMRAAIGDRWVNVDEQTIFAYRDPYASLDDEAFLPSCVIAPASVDEVRNVLAIANERGITLWPVSTGKNYAYGGPAPRMKGTAVLDLRRMNKIIEVNEELGYAFVEPGVSYFDLYKHLRSIGSKLWIDCAAPGWGGVMGNALERGAGYTPYGDHWAMQCGLEVVLANGSVIRTGMGGVPQSKAWGAFKYGYGPYLDGIFTQSNFGVVTKMGIWLMEQPPAHRPLMIAFPEEGSLGEIVDALLPLRKNLVLNGGLILSGLIWEGGSVSPRARWYTGSGAMPESAMKTMASDLDLGMWNLVAGLYGTPNSVNESYATIVEVMGNIRGARFYGAEDRPNDPAWTYRKKLMMGEPNMAEFNLLNWVGGGGHLSFSPCLPFAGEDALKVYDICSTTTRAAGFDWIGEFATQLRSTLQIQVFGFDRTDPSEMRRVHETFELLISRAAAAGFGEYRTQLAFMDQVAQMYSFEGNSLLRLQEAIKDALDPKGILAPGKSGIWPAAMRAQRHV